MANSSCSSVRSLHHVEVLCSNAEQRAESFCSTYGFRVFARKHEHVAARSDSTVFLFRERGTLYPVDTVATLSFTVRDVQESFDRAVSAGGTSQMKPTILEDRFGRMAMAEVCTPFGNASLRFLAPLDYNGVFLPGYERTEDCTSSLSSCSTCTSADELTCGCDHVTYACLQGTLDKCVDWFAASLGFQRCTINRSESREDGFIVDYADGSVGMRLKAMDYFRCRESSLVLTSSSSSASRNATPGTASLDGCHDISDYKVDVKLVFAEPLYGGPNQVQLFLNDHGGPGIQHIGLTSSDIFKTISAMRQANADFIFIPPEFYTQCQHLVQESQVSLPDGTLSRLESSNILLDVEDNEVQDTTKYLMQAFTRPLFGQSTFFLEVIQRVGATGFGAGNITALWRALQQHFASGNQLQGERKLAVDVS